MSGNVINVRFMDISSLSRDQIAEVLLEHRLREDEAHDDELHCACTEGDYYTPGSQYIEHAQHQAEAVIAAGARLLRRSR